MSHVPDHPPSPVGLPWKRSSSRRASAAASSTRSAEEPAPPRKRPEPVGLPWNRSASEEVGDSRSPLRTGLLGRLGLLVCLLILSIGTLTACARGKGEFGDISQADLAKAVEARKVTLLDCNAPEFYENTGHLPRAISFARNQDRLEKLLPGDKNALIVAYCMNNH